MAEILTLTEPQTFPSLTGFQVESLELNWHEQLIRVGVVSNTNARRTFAYSGPTAVALMSALNKANLTIKSLQRRVLEHLVADGLLAGSISGSPD